MDVVVTVENFPFVVYPYILKKNSHLPELSGVYMLAVNEGGVRHIKYIGLTRKLNKRLLSHNKRDEIYSSLSDGQNAEVLFFEINGGHGRLIERWFINKLKPVHNKQIPQLIKKYPSNFYNYIKSKNNEVGIGN